MYEDIVEEMKDLDKEVIKSTKRMKKAFSLGVDSLENARINETLEREKIRTISVDEIIKITGVNNVTKRKNKR